MTPEPSKTVPPQAEPAKAAGASPRRRRLRIAIAIGAAVLVLATLIWLSHDTVRLTRQATFSLQGGESSVTVPLDTPTVPHNPVPLLATRLNYWVARTTGRGLPPADATLAVIRANVSDVETRRGNWTRVKYQIRRLFGGADPGTAAAIVSVPLQTSSPLFLRVTPEGSLYVSAYENRRTMIHTALLPMDSGVSDRVAAILCEYWEGWPQKPEPSRNPAFFMPIPIP